MFIRTCSLVSKWLCGGVCAYVARGTAADRWTCCWLSSSLSLLSRCLPKGCPRSLRESSRSSYLQRVQCGANLVVLVLRSSNGVAQQSGRSYSSPTYIAESLQRGISLLLNTSFQRGDIFRLPLGSRGPNRHISTFATTARLLFTIDPVKPAGCTFALNTQLGRTMYCPAYTAGSYNVCRLLNRRFET